MRKFKHIHRKKLFVVCIFLSISFATQTEEVSSLNDSQLDSEFTQRYCSINVPPKPRKTVKLPYNLSFFISPNPNGEEVAVIADFNNRLVNLSDVPDGHSIVENKDEQVIPGVVDPVFTPDGKYITLPSSKFISYANAKKNGEKQCQFLEEENPITQIYVKRLPIIKTDQTSSIFTEEQNNGLEEMLMVLKEMNKLMK